MSRQRLGPAAFLLVGVLSLLEPHAASATTYLAPDRELARDDRVALTVHRAGLIVVGHAISERDTTVGLNSDTFQKVMFVPERGLKGRPVREPFEFCSLPSSDHNRHRGGMPARSPERLVPNSHTLLFVQEPHFKGATAATYGGALQLSCSWYAIEASSPYYLNDRQVWSAELESEVRRAVSRQEIDALLKRAERIVLGRLLPFAAEAKRDTGYAVPPRTIAVSKTFKGMPEARLEVQPVLLFLSRSMTTETQRDILWLLRRTGKGTLEPVELLAGILEVRDGRVDAWGMTLEEVRLRIDREP